VDRVLTHDGTRVAVYDFGGTGADLLLLHATGFCAGVLLPLARHLGDRFRCWAVDLRSHGRSDPPPDGDFRWSGFADDVGSTIAQLGLDRPFVFGHSCGGAAAVLAEESEPGTFARIYCFEPVVLPAEPPPVEVADNPMSARARRRRDTFPSAADAVANFAAKPPFRELDPEVLRLYVDEGLTPVPADEGGDGKAVRLRCRRDHEAAIYAHAALHGAYAGLPAVACPVTLACGSRTDSFGPEVLGLLAARLDRARIEVLPGIGHFGPLEDPVLVATSVRGAFPETDTPEP